MGPSTTAGSLGEQGRRRIWGVDPPSHPRLCVQGCGPHPRLRSGPAPLPQAWAGASLRSQVPAAARATWQPLNNVFPGKAPDSLGSEVGRIPGRGGAADPGGRWTPGFSRRGQCCQATNCRRSALGGLHSRAGRSSPGLPLKLCFLPYPPPPGTHRTTAAVLATPLPPRGLLLGPVEPAALLVLRPGAPAKPSVTSSTQTCCFLSEHWALEPWPSLPHPGSPVSAGGTHRMSPSKAFVPTSWPLHPSQEEQTPSALGWAGWSPLRRPREQQPGSGTATARSSGSVCGDPTGRGLCGSMTSRQALPGSTAKGGPGTERTWQSGVWAACSDRAMALGTAWLQDRMPRVTERDRCGCCTSEGDPDQDSRGQSGRSRRWTLTCWGGARPHVPSTPVFLCLGLVTPQG